MVAGALQAAAMGLLVSLGQDTFFVFGDQESILLSRGSDPLGRFSTVSTFFGKRPDCSESFSALRRLSF
jgi:hypothetical protein